jgi:hypothetical protein
MGSVTARRAATTKGLMKANNPLPSGSVPEVEAYLNACRVLIKDFGRFAQGVAVVVIGALAIWVSEPKMGSVEWHKREYLRDWNRAAGNTWTDYVRRRLPIARRIIEPGVTFEELREIAPSLHSNHNALVSLGYVVTTTVSVTNQPPDVVAKAVQGKYPGEPFVSIFPAWPTNDAVRVRALRAEIDKICQRVREMDRPAPGNPYCVLATKVVGLVMAI